MASRLLSRAEIGLVAWECRVLYSGYEALTAHYPGPSPWTQGRSVGGRGINRSSPAAFRDSCDHRYCPIIWRGYQAFHMGPQRNGCDIFYSSGICPHGVRLEGRGPGVKSGAQGTAEGNRRSVGIQYMGGITTGGVLDPLTDEAKNAYYDEAARFNRPLRWGHKDWLDAQGRVRTACPGGVVYAWRLTGFPRPATPPPPPPPLEEDEDVIIHFYCDGRPARVVVDGVVTGWRSNAARQAFVNGVKDTRQDLVKFPTKADYEAFSASFVQGQDFDHLNEALDAAIEQWSPLFAASAVRLQALLEVEAREEQRDTAPPSSPG